MLLTSWVEVFFLPPSVEQSSAASSRVVPQMVVQDNHVLEQENCKVHLSSAGCETRQSKILYYLNSLKVTTVERYLACFSIANFQKLSAFFHGIVRKVVVHWKLEFWPLFLKSTKNEQEKCYRGYSLVNIERWIGRCICSSVSQSISVCLWCDRRCGSWGCWCATTCVGNTGRILKLRYSLIVK